jgi:hypothetical protein
VSEASYPEILKGMKNPIGRESYCHRANHIIVIRVVEKDDTVVIWLAEFSLMLRFCQSARSF